MPPRPIILAIVAFWLAMTGWLFWRDLLPQMRPGEPPPFKIDLVDEAQRQGAPINWKVTRNEQDAFTARTHVEYVEADDAFNLICELRPRFRAGHEPAYKLSMDSLYRVTREGELRALDVKITLPPVELRIEGEVKDGRFAPRLSFRGPLEGEQQLSPVEVSSWGSVLNPLQPLNRLPGLKPGQHWRMPLIDPLRDALQSALARSRHIPSVDAIVLPETQELEWAGEIVDCLVIEYTGDDFHARTWVRASDGLVLCQETDHGGERWVMERQKL